MRRIGALLLALCAFGEPVLAQVAAPTREAALRLIERPQAADKVAGLERLGLIGRMQDTAAMAKLLADPDEAVHAVAEAALWKLWGRSGDPRIDALYRKGVSQMNPQKLEAAAATFSEIIRRKPEFAEGWNKRATVLFFLGRYRESLADCDEVMKRNPHHFGALSGVGQIHSRLEDYEKALEAFEKALAVNPHMPGVQMSVQALREIVKERTRKST